MLSKLINEVDKALEQGLYYCALSMALALPDICGKVKYPQERQSQRYQKWFNDYVTFIPNQVSHGEPISFNGFACWQLRCSFLHSGDFDLTVGAPSIRIKRFRLFYSVQNPRQRSAAYFDDDGYVLDLNVSFLCKLICLRAQEFYSAEENKDAFGIAEILDISEHEDVGVMVLNCNLPEDYLKR